MSVATASHKLLVIGLCGESIFVDWNDQDTVGRIKEQAFLAASQQLHGNLVRGVSPEQLHLVFGQPHDAVKLENGSCLQDCLRAHWR